MSFLDAFFKSKTFSQDYRDKQFQKSLKKVKDEGEVVIKIIQKYNPDLTTEKMKEMFKPPKKPSVKKIRKQMQKYMKVVGLEAFKEIMEYNLRQVGSSLERTVTRSFQIDFIVRDWMNELIKKARNVNETHLSQALNKIEKFSLLEVSLSKDSTYSQAWVNKGVVLRHKNHNRFSF